MLTFWKIFIPICILVVIIGGVMAYEHSKNVDTSYTMNEPQKYTVTSQSNSDDALARDQVEIDTQIGALNTDSAAVDSSFNDQQISQ